MLVAEFMTPDPITVGPKQSLETALKAMDEYCIRHLPVVDDGYLVGVLSQRDLLGLTGWGLLGPDDPDSQQLRWVSQAMHVDVITAAPEDQVLAAAREVTARGIGCLPVVAEGKLRGIVSEMDLVRLVAMAGCSGATVLSIGTSRAIAASPASTLAQLDQLMSAKGVRHLPVEDGDELVGLVTDRDVRRAKGAGLSPDAQASEFMTRDIVSVPADLPLEEAAAVMFDRRIGALVIRSEEGLGIVTTTDLLNFALGMLER